MDQKVRIGFVGVGNMGQCAHLRNFVEIPGCEVVALAEPRRSLAAAVASRYSVPHTYSNAEEMVASEAIDALVVIQPFEHHGSVVMPLFRHGLPILTEKPLASSVQTGERMVEALRAGGGRHFLGYHKRSDPATAAAVAEVRRLRSTRELGDLRYVRLTMPEGDWIAGGFNDLIKTDEKAPAVEPDARPADLSQEKFKRSTAFVNYYIHQVNLLRFLGGESFVVEHVEPSGIVITFRFVGGAVGLLEMSPYRTSSSWQESAFVAFERGFVDLRLPAPLVRNQAGTVEFFRDGGKCESESVRPGLPAVHAMARQAEEFVRAVRGIGTDLCGAAEALEDLRIARAVAEHWPE